jgi:sensor histidine kinase YesM
MKNNPILSSLKNLILYLVFWLIITVLQLNILNFAGQTNWRITILDSLVFNFILGGFGLFFWYPAKYISIEKSSIQKVLFSHLVSAVLVTVVWLALGFFIMQQIFNEESYSSFFRESLPWRFLIGLLLYFVLTVFYYVFIYYQSLQEKLLEEARLKSLVMESELKSLKLQLNPHFIFNSLNSISALTDINASKAKEMILKLAEFLRHTLINNERQFNTLDEELKTVRIYLEIEKIRFSEGSNGQDKFIYTEEIEEKCKSISVPSMILQPLFENVIKHAVYESFEPVHIKFKCNLINDYLRISLENNFEPAGSSAKGAGIGINNIRNRLELIYARKNLLEINKTNNLFRVDVFIPLAQS